MTTAGFFTADEAAALTLKDASFSGTLRGLPFEAIHYLALPEVNEPMVLHIDLSYFQGLYDNEIKTPLYELIHQAASTLNQSGWKPLATTLSYSTLEGEIALETRFVISNLAEILANPSLLAAESMPSAWGLRAEGLYAADMFTESKKLELYREAAELAPNDPTALYDLFQAHFMAKEIDQALATLDRAVAFDPGYAATYLALADMALKDSNAPITFELLTKAKPFFPYNPFVDLQRADLLLQKGDSKAAIEVLETLKQEQWSTLYRSEMPSVIDNMLQAALNPPVSEGKADAQ
jgi:tetratricopeptide (TPR) repeat protein